MFVVLAFVPHMIQGKRLTEGIHAIPLIFGVLFGIAIQVAF